MKNFRCVCGQILFFENTRCTACSRQVGYDPLLGTLLALEPNFGRGTKRILSWKAAYGGAHYRLCRNEIDYQICNWLVSRDGDDYCLACDLNQVVPGGDYSPQNEKRRGLWASTEQAKRRLLYSLLCLGLDLESKAVNPTFGLAFAFLEDQKSNPNVDEAHVSTGHYQGLITVNLAEADHAIRVRARQNLGESYRTLLGHFRHESGHYYFDRLLANSANIEQFREVFGDERVDYAKSLKAYYASQSSNVPAEGMISNYAQSHPLEDWAECWAHYLHIMDTLETAAQYGMADSNELLGGAAWDIEQGFKQWGRVTVTLNSLNRSMGLEDAYPFVLSQGVLTKLRFVHQTIYPSQKPMQTAASV
jgi:hypothetical protein